MSKPSSTRQPTSHLAPFGVRMQPELKSRLEEAAVKSGRSMNSEIVARLEQSLENDIPADFDLGIFADSGKPGLPELRLTIDTGDQPICWDEIHEYMQAIRKTIDAKIFQLSVTIKTPELVSSTVRKTEAQALTKKLRKKRSSAT